MATERIKEFKNEHVPKYYTGDEFVKPVYLSVHRSRCYTEVWQTVDMGSDEAKGSAKGRQG
jgi:hypothetical protein